MDEFGIKPIAPPIDLPEEAQEKVFEQDDIQTAAAYFHPSWGKVEEILLNEIDSLTVKPSEALPADEYKIQSLADEKARSAIIAVLGKVKNAVIATEETRTGE